MTRQSLSQKLTGNRVWKSIFRVPNTGNDENRARIIAESFFWHIHPVKVKTHSLKITYTWGLGVISFFLFLLLTFTGIWLMFFYTPSVDTAYQNISELETRVNYGILIRTMHRWGAHLMVLAVFLHLCRVFFTGSYKRPREFNWVVGVLLWLITLLLSFTGYLLPWDQLSYWAVTVGTNIAASIPVIGEQLRVLVLGSKEIGQDTLTRFYALHVMVLPVVMSILIGVHFWRIRKDGGLSSPMEQEEDVNGGER